MKKTALKALGSKSAAVRGWAITAAAEGGQLSPALAGRLKELSISDPSPVVRRRLASALQRLAPGARWAFLDGLVAHGEDSDDRNLPLMLWYGAESAVAADPARGVALLKNSRLPKVAELIARRVTSMAVEKPEAANPGMEALVQQLGEAGEPTRASILDGILAGAKGQARLRQAGGWEAVYAKLKSDPSPGTRLKSQTLALLFGSQIALEDLRASLSDPAAALENRRAAVELLAARRDALSLAPLMSLLGAPGPLVAPALRALASYEDARIAPRLVSQFAALEHGERREAMNTLLSRPANAAVLLAAIDAGTIARKELTAPLVRVLQGFNQPDFEKWVEKNWGAVKTSSAEKQLEIAKYKKFLGSDAILRANLKNGREIFQRTCAVCHTLFGQGGKIGPELPGNFSDVDYLLQNILDPNAIIGKNYQQTFVTTKSGQLRAGILAAEDAQAVTLKTLAGSETVPRSEIVKIEVSPMSMMPEGLLSSMTESEVRDLFLYLRQPQN